jgi:hypothetical protein
VLEVNGGKHLEIMGSRHFQARAIKWNWKKKYGDSKEKMRFSNKRGIS